MKRIALLTLLTGLPLPVIAQTPSKVSLTRKTVTVKDAKGSVACAYEKPVFTHTDKAIEGKLNKKIDTIYKAASSCGVVIEFEEDTVSEKLVSLSFTVAVASDAGGATADFDMQRVALNLMLSNATHDIIELPNQEIDAPAASQLKKYCKDYLSPKGTNEVDDPDQRNEICGGLSTSTPYTFTTKGAKFLLLYNVGSNMDRGYSVIVPYTSWSASLLLLGLP